MAKKAVDSTLRRILNYTAEIIISLILLVTICIPLAFTIPMWFEHVIFGVPRTELAINPANWWGLDGTLWITLGFALLSFSLAYLYILKMKPGDTSVSPEDEPEEEDEAEEEDLADEDIAAEDIPAEDIEEKAAEDIEEEAAEDIPLEDQEDEEEPDTNEESEED